MHKEPRANPRTAFLAPGHPWPPNLRLRLQNKAGSESVTVEQPTGGDIGAIKSSIDRLLTLTPADDIRWAVGSSDVVRPGADCDTIGSGFDAVAMVDRWLA